MSRFPQSLYKAPPRPDEHLIIIERDPVIRDGDVTDLGRVVGANVARRSGMEC
ncbi:MAG: hypothetical protein WBS33_14280 [Verrucomicrobiia bacterium]